MYTLLATVVVWLTLAYGGVAAAATCLYVSSYHAGYAGNDAIEAGMASAIHGQCDLHTFYMDTKRHTDPAFAEHQALAAKDLITRLQPDAWSSQTMTKAILTGDTVASAPLPTSRHDGRDYWVFRPMYNGKEVLERGLERLSPVNGTVALRIHAVLMEVQR
jgi:hypothetical protein